MPLNKQKLTDVEPDPMLTPGVYDCQIKDAKEEPNKKGTGNNLNLMMEVTNDEVTTIEGETKKNAGKVVFMTISLVPVHNEGKRPYDPDARLRELADAIGHPPEEDLEIADLIGKHLQARIKYREEQTNPNSGETYPPRNEVAGFVKAKA